MNTADFTPESRQPKVRPAVAITPEDELRAQIYRLLSGFLTAPPDQTRLVMAAGLYGDDGEFGTAINNFAAIAARFDEASAGDEYHDLFIGVTRGELLPYGSYYQTGFLNEKPLARLRRDMGKLGVERISSLKEPEDNIASVLEIMAGMIDGSYEKPCSLKEQEAFFIDHVNSWTSHFFTDLEKAENSVLYAPLGTIGRLFMGIETAAFKMA